MVGGWRSGVAGPLPQTRSLSDEIVELQADRQRRRADLEQLAP